MLNSIRWSWTSPGSDQVPSPTSTGVPNRDECIIKQEAPQCSVEAADSGEAPDSLQTSTEEAEWTGVSAAAARAGLYDEHEVKDELVLGPERLQAQDIALEPAVGSNSADKSVEQDVVRMEITGENASPAQNLHLNSLLEQLVHSTCYVRLERTPVSKEITYQTPYKSFDLSSLMSDCNKHREEETDVEQNIRQETKVHTKRKNYICDFCGKQFAQKTYLTKHIGIHMEQNADTLHRMSNEQFTVKRKLIKQQSPRRGAGRGPRRGAGRGPRRGAGRGPRRGAGRGPRRGAGRGPRRGTGRGPSVVAGRGPRRGAGRGPRRGAGRGPRRGAGQGPRRGAGRGPRRGAGRGPRRGAGQGPGSGRGPRRGAGRGPRSGQGRGVRLQRVPIDKHPHKAVDPLDNGCVSFDSAVDTKITKKPYCDICDKEFSSVQYLKKHITKHLWKEEFVCEICKQKFSENCHLIKHIEEVHTDQEIKQSNKVYSCNFCKKVLSSKRSVMVHERMHTGEKPFSCNVCIKQFADKNSLTKHIRIHTGEKPFTCEFCFKKFAESGQMTTHRRTHNTGLKKHTCEICQKQCVSLKAHMVIHTGEKPYVCEFCGKAFSNGGTLVNHRRLHQTEEYFACDVCKRRFRLQANLDRHKQSCTPFTCDICMKQFRRRTCLRNHKRVHTEENPYPCEICQASYITIKGLADHKKRHLEKPFTCDICKKQFKSKEMIISHIPIHTRMGDMGEKPYKCDICQKPFARFTHVSAHKKIHFKKPFTCDICKKKIKTKHKMLFHIKTHATGEESYACEFCHKPFTTQQYVTS